ncbi:MAG: ribosome maturation factor RimP [Actinomycetota bacterium]|nr:ribosome maturation factor RimP [Actinomycetota bacterium]
MGTTEVVEQVVTPLLGAHHLRLYDVELAGGTLRVVVERAGGIDLETLGELTREVSAALDAADPLPGRYTLEVSSPGLERTLRRPDHFAGALGTRIRVKTKPGTEGDRRVEGELVAADGEHITVLVDGEPRTLALHDIERARTVFEWGPAAAGTRRRGKATTS